MNPIYTLWNGSTIDLSRIVYVSSRVYDKKFNGLKIRCVCLITLDCCINPIEVTHEEDNNDIVALFTKGVEELINNWKNFKT